MTQPILANKGAVTMSTQLTAPKAYKRSPSLANSSWYKGILVTQLAGETDNGGTFDLAVAKVRKGTEPPPHVHARDDEFFYILSGSIRFYTEGQVFDVGAGESMFLPKGKPHAFQIQSDEIHSITLITPGGFLNAVNQMNEPAQKMEIPSDDVLTYANMDLTKTKEIFETYGVHILSPEEVAEQMREFPFAKH
jgi:mannose-6-phosphate isomerase-like protein (cupin superfamily)